MYAIVGLVANGIGAALVPASMRALGITGVVYHGLADAPAALSAELALLWRRGEPSSVVTRFLDLARRSSREGRLASSATGAHDGRAPLR